MAYVKLQPKETVEASSRNVSRRPGGRDHGPSRRVNTSKIIVSPYEDSVVHHILKGHHFEKIWPGGVYLGLDYSVDNSEHIFKVKKGYGTIYGRQFEIDEDYEISLSALTGLKYCVVFVEVNLRAYTAQKATIKLQYAGAGFPEVKFDDLVKKQNGVARLVLYEFRYEATSASPFQDIKSVFYTYEDGTAENVRCLEATAKINGRLVSNLLYHNADRFLKTNRTTYTDLGKKLGENGWIAADDQMGFYKGEDGRYLLMCVPNAFHITGQTYKGADTVPSKGYYLNENTTYKFYTQDGTNPVPQGARVVGIWMQGKLRSIRWKGGFTQKWVTLGDNQYFGVPFVRQDAAFLWWRDEGETPKSTAGHMFPGDVWTMQRVLRFGHAAQETGRFIGLWHDKFGTVLGDPKLDYWHYHSGATGKGFGYPTAGTFQFKNTLENKPYIEISIEDDVALAVDFWVSIFYVRGTDMRGKAAATNPFTSLNPQLEGGQQ